MASQHTKSLAKYVALAYYKAQHLVHLEGVAFLCSKTVKSHMLRSFAGAWHTFDITGAMSLISEEAVALLPCRCRKRSGFDFKFALSPKGGRWC